MEELKPLIDSAAYWIEADANIRVASAIFGISIAALALAGFAGIALWLCLSSNRKGSD